MGVDDDTTEKRLPIQINGKEYLIRVTVDHVKKRIVVNQDDYARAKRAAEAS